MAGSMLPGMSDAAAGSVPTATTGGGLARGALLGYRWVLAVFLLAGVVQIFLAGYGVWGGLHAVDGLAILGLAGFLHGAAIRRTGTGISPR
jgi:hypothetical protein